MQQTTLNLKKFEQTAYQRTYQDGLVDITTGGTLASFAAFGFKIFPGSDLESWQVLLFFLAGAGLSNLVFWLGKIYITLPRIGLVKFGPARQKRLRDLALTLAAIVALQALVVLVQFVFTASPAVPNAWVPSSTLLLAVLTALFVTPGMLLIAFLMDTPRGYYNAVVLSLAVFLMILLDTAWWMVLGGALIILPGIFQLVWFLRRYPLESIPDERP